MDMTGAIWDQLLSFAPSATRALTHVDSAFNAAFELACGNANERPEVKRCMAPRAYRAVRELSNFS